MKGDAPGACILLPRPDGGQRRREAHGASPDPRQRFRARGRRQRPCSSSSARHARCLGESPTRNPRVRGLPRPDAPRDRRMPTSRRRSMRSARFTAWGPRGSRVTGSRSSRRSTTPVERWRLRRLRPARWYGRQRSCRRSRARRGCGRCPEGLCARPATSAAAPGAPSRGNANQVSVVVGDQAGEEGDSPSPDTVAE